MFEGRVEICFYGFWGTVSWLSLDSHEATVICRELGFLQAGLVTSKEYVTERAKRVHSLFMSIEISAIICLRFMHTFSHRE